VRAVDALHARAEALRAAAGMLGGERKLAAFLDVPAPEVRAWLDGQAEPPLEAFLNALDVIADGPLGPRKRRIKVAVLPES
jgi:hypothetical protein